MTLVLAPATAANSVVESGTTATGLAGRRIVVTRPETQAEGLIRAIEAAGGEALRFPVLAIAEAEDPAPILALAERLEEFDLALFVSANAVHKALTPILAQRTWPATLTVGTVGKASEAALASHGFQHIIAPQDRFDSEALLALAPLHDVAGKRVVIFRGDGGRELLADTLRQRGATVEYLTCYRRSQPDGDTAPLFAAWHAGRLSALTITSSEGLRNLWAMLGADQPGSGRDLLQHTPLFVGHERIAEQARQLGLGRVHVTASGDAGLVSALIAYFGRLA